MSEITKEQIKLGEEWAASIKAGHSDLPRMIYYKGSYIDPRDLDDFKDFEDWCDSQSIYPEEYYQEQEKERRWHMSDEYSKTVDKIERLEANKEDNDGVQVAIDYLKAGLKYRSRESTKSNLIHFKTNSGNWQQINQEQNNQQGTHKMKTNEEIQEYYTNRLEQDKKYSHYEELFLDICSEEEFNKYLTMNVRQRQIFLIDWYPKNKDKVELQNE